MRLRKHLSALELDSTGDYLSWCRDNGFSPSLEKDHRELHEEREALRRQQDQGRSHAKIHRKPKRLIEDACEGRIDPNDIKRPGWHELCLAIHESKPDQESRRALRDLLLTVHDRAGFLLESVNFGPHSYHYVDALIRLNDRRAQWIMTLESWHPDTHNRHRQFSSLVRHLLTRYTIPVFMDSAWFRRDKGSYRLRDWFIHIGAGKNLRTANCPVPLTKRMAHCFLEAPQSYSIENAIRWGQIHALGGDRRLTEEVLGTPIGESFEHDEFWVSVFRFLIANPMLDRKHVGPIVDYLRAQKFTSREVITEPGCVEIEPPPQPNLSMRGRTPENLLNQVERWHHELGRARGAGALFFKRSGFKELAGKTGKDKADRWRVRELLSGAQLISEGRTMRHCVASYAQSCARGHCSSWAMELHRPLGVDKRQTVEVNDHGMIVQSRGKANRRPTTGEYDVLRRWAREAGLTISSYLHPDH